MGGTCLSGARPKRNEWSRGALAVALALLAAAIGGFAAKDEALADLIARADSARLQAQPSLYAEIAERQLRAADQLYDQAKMDEARAAVKDVVTYSDKACDAALRSGSKLKGTEIAVRKMAEKLRDIRRNLPFEEQKLVEDAADNLETMRTSLLSRMFGKAEKK